MNWKRTVLLGVMGGALAVWLAAAATSVPSPIDPALSRGTTPVELRGAALATEVTRLRERLRPTAVPLLRRDLFRYRSGAAAALHESPLTNAFPSPVVDLAPPAPSFLLVGLAEDPGPDGPVRTAIISRAGELFIVKEGDAVTSQYQVAKISADVVELTGTGAGAATPLRLALP